MNNLLVILGYVFALAGFVCSLIILLGRYRSHARRSSNA